MKNHITCTILVLALSGCKPPENAVETKTKPDESTPIENIMEPTPTPEPEVEPTPSPTPEPTPAAYPLKGVWQNQGDPNLIFSFGNTTGSELSCALSFNWVHLNYTLGPQFGAAQIRLSQVTGNTSPAYCRNPNGLQTYDCSWVQLNAEGTQMQLSGCLYGASPNQNNVWLRVQ